MCAPQSRPRALIPHAVKRSSSWLSFPPVWCSVHARTAVCPSYHKCPSGLFAVWGRSGGYLEANAFRSPLPLPSLPSTLSPLFSLPCFPPLSSHPSPPPTLGTWVGARRRGRAWPHERARSGALSQLLFPPPR